MEQVGTPQSIYDESATEFVCNFIGDSSRLSADFVAELNRQSRRALDPSANSYLRVEKASLDPAADGSAVPVDGTVISRTYHGLHSRTLCAATGLRSACWSRRTVGFTPSPAAPRPYTSSRPRAPVPPGDRISLDSRLQEANRA